MAAAVAGCGGLPSISDLKGMPEVALHPNDASLISHNEHARYDTVDGPVPAIVGDVFGTQMKPDQVYAWYGKELGARGWKPGELAIATSIEDSARAWRKGDVIARIGIRSKNSPQNPPTPSTEAFETVYETALVAEAPQSFAPMPS